MIEIDETSYSKYSDKKAKQSKRAEQSMARNEDDSWSTQNKTATTIFDELLNKSDESSIKKKP